MKRSLLALALACVGACAFAQGPGFRCGGIGVHEQEQFKSEAAQHYALLTFARDTGAYMANIDVSVKDRSGNVVVQGHCDGPLMLLDLPGHGQYQVTASADGRTQQHTIDVGRTPARATFIWPAA